MGLGWARGGRLAALGREPLRALPLLGIAVVLVLLARLSPAAPDAARALGVAGYLVAIFALWQNRAAPWVLVIVLGLALNSLALAANGGRMPVSGEALSGAGGPIGLGAETVLTPRYVLAGPGTRMTALGDTLSVRIGNAGVVLSPGDVVMALGLAAFVQRRMRGATPS